MRRSFRRHWGMRRSAHQQRRQQRLLAQPAQALRTYEQTLGPSDHQDQGGHAKQEPVRRSAGQRLRPTIRGCIHARRHSQPIRLATRHSVRLVS